MVVLIREDATWFRHSAYPSQLSTSRVRRSIRASRRSEIKSSVPLFVPRVNARTDRIGFGAPTRKMASATGYRSPQYAMTCRSEFERDRTAAARASGALSHGSSFCRVRHSTSERRVRPVEIPAPVVATDRLDYERFAAREPGFRMGNTQSTWRLRTRWINDRGMTSRDSRRLR